MQRMQDRGQEVVVSLFMDSVLYPESPSRNLLIDLVGSELPDEYGNMFGAHRVCSDQTQDRLYVVF